MHTLRRFLCGCYGFLAFVSILIVPRQVLSLLHPSEPASLSHMAEWLALSTTLVSLLTFGMAWWTVQTGKRWSRIWAIAANVLLVVNLAPPFVIWPAHISVSFMIGPAIVLAFAACGLIAFAWPGTSADAPVERLRPVRIAGDGTSRLLDAITWLLGICGYLAGVRLWGSWARTQDLPTGYGLYFWPQLLGAFALTITVHELGHAFTGLALGMRLKAFTVGPFHWRIQNAKWKFKFLPTRVLMQSGSASLVPTDPNQPRWHEICMLAAGPVANLYTGLVAFALTLTCGGSPYEDAWFFLAMFSTLSLVFFAVNLIPIRPEAHYFDGARIYQLLRGGPLADYFRAFNLASAIFVSPIRPRDYDIDAIQRASASFTQGRQAILLRFFAYNYFHDCGRIPEACQALDQAEAIYNQSPSELPAGRHKLFVTGNAFLKRDPVNARLWWNRSENVKVDGFDEIRWLALSAHLWIENNRKEAIDAWEKGNCLAQQRPKAGGHDFNRDCFAEYRQILETSPPETQPT